MSLELNPEIEMVVLERAAKEGVSVNDLIARTFAAPQQDAMPTKDPTLALFAQWEHEDAQKSPEEVAAEDRLWEEFEKGINATRQAQGMRQL